MLPVKFIALIATKVLVATIAATVAEKALAIIVVAGALQWETTG